MDYTYVCVCVCVCVYVCVRARVCLCVIYKLWITHIHTRLASQGERLSFLRTRFSLSLYVCVCVCVHRTTYKRTPTQVDMKTVCDVRVSLLR